MNLGRPLMKGIPWILLLKLPETPKVSGPLISAYVELGSNYYTLVYHVKQRQFCMGNFTHSTPS